MGVAFAAAGGVAQGDGVGRRVEADFMRAGVGAGAVGGKTQRAGIPGGLDFFSEFFESAGGGIFFCGVMNFPAPGFVFGVRG